MPMRNIFPLLLLTGLFFTGPCYSLDELNADSEDTHGDGYIEPKPWEEGDFVIPPYPNADDLLKVEVDRGEMPFNFYLDSKNLLPLPKLGVTRYTIVIESETGAKNVLFEGLRCQTGEFRTYAYGTFDKKFSKARTSKWQLIRRSGGMAHRYDFYLHYMCSEYRNQNPVDAVIQKVKYPENFQVSDERDD